MLYKNNSVVPIVVLLFCAFLSCKTQSYNLSCKTYEYNMCAEDVPYKHEIGYKNIYLVDTVKIENPVSFTTTDGRRRVMTSYEIFSTLKIFNDDVLQIEGVFLFDTSFPGVPIELYHLCPGYEHVNFESNDIEGVPRSINARKYSNPITFSVYLINQKFYNTYFTGIDTPYMFDNTKMDHMYMLMLFPIY